MWFQQIILAAAGLSAGATVAGGACAFIVELGILADFADRTHTGEKILLYEDAAAAGFTAGSLVTVFGIHLPGGLPALAVFGLTAGIFTGCWAMALAEVLQVFPVMIRRTGLTSCISWAVAGMALGRGAGALLYFWNRW